MKFKNTIIAMLVMIFSVYAMAETIVVTKDSGEKIVITDVKKVESADITAKQQLFPAADPDPDPTPDPDPDPTPDPTPDPDPVPTDEWPIETKVYTLPSNGQDYAIPDWAPEVLPSLAETQKRIAALPALIKADPTNVDLQEELELLQRTLPRPRKLNESNLIWPRPPVDKNVFTWTDRDVELVGGFYIYTGALYSVAKWLTTNPDGFDVQGTPDNMDLLMPLHVNATASHVRVNVKMTPGTDASKWARYTVVDNNPDETRIVPTIYRLPRYKKDYSQIRASFFGDKIIFGTRNAYNTGTSGARWSSGVEPWIGLYDPSLTDQYNAAVVAVIDATKAEQAALKAEAAAQAAVDADPTTANKLALATASVARAQAQQATTDAAAARDAVEKEAFKHYSLEGYSPQHFGGGFTLVPQSFADKFFGGRRLVLNRGGGLSGQGSMNGYGALLVRWTNDGPTDPTILQGYEWGTITKDNEALLKPKQMKRPPDYARGLFGMPQPDDTDGDGYGDIGYWCIAAARAGQVWLDHGTKRGLINVTSNARGEGYWYYKSAVKSSNSVPRVTVIDPAQWAEVVAGTRKPWEVEATWYGIANVKHVDQFVSIGTMQVRGDYLYAVFDMGFKDNKQLGTGIAVFKLK